ncbi:hypothetical protein SAMN03159343_0891 [Klenkia marina]|uniref:Uncharacterized protein n=1 Tax=Klenkia marina TaxID=1960309 RepID=A0A1G4XFX9_9ACTN|nr:hypothetical protein SAMN03159343_0891 [Klenkia marina]
MTDPNHPGWPLWERTRQKDRAMWERFRVMDQRAGLPTASYQELPDDPGPERLDMLVQLEAEQREEEKVFTYRIATWRKLGTKQILASHWVVDGGQETILFDVPSHTWIWDPVSASEIAHQADEDPYVLLEPATREQAEELARLKGTTLPSPERLLEMCRNQEGRELGMSATSEDRARLRNRQR